MEDYMSKDSKFGQQAKILTFHPTGEYYFTKGLKAYHRRELPKSKNTWNVRWNLNLLNR